MGGGRRFFRKYNQPDPEHGSNAHYGRRDGRDLIQVLSNSLRTITNGSNLALLLFNGHKPSPNRAYENISSNNQEITKSNILC